MLKVAGAISIFGFIIGCQSTLGNDTDWDLMFYDNCGMPQDDSMEWIEKNGKKFIRFRLRDKDYGGCASDRVARHRAPYWERAELKQSTFLSFNKKYQLKFKVRFVQGFIGQRESFWQMHASGNSCRAGPPIMIKMTGGKLNINPRGVRANKPGGGSSPIYSNIAMDDLVGKWVRFKLVLDTSERARISLFLNDEIIFEQIPYWIQRCGSPHFKFGIYRPGSLNKNRMSVVDFDEIKLKVLDEEYVSK